jgi:hypothetical protein
MPTLSAVLTVFVSLRLPPLSAVSHFFERIIHGLQLDSLGGSLWNDLMSDINLDSLEKTLEEHEISQQKQQDQAKPLPQTQQTQRHSSWNNVNRSGSNAPPNTPAGTGPTIILGAAGGAGPFVAGSNSSNLPFLNAFGASSAVQPASAASMVVSHQAQRHSELNNTTTTTSASRMPAAPPSFLNFDSSAAEAFLAADSHKKSFVGSAPLSGGVSRPPPGVGVSAGVNDATTLIKSMLLDENEAYNVNEEPTAAGSVNLFAASQQKGPAPPPQPVLPNKNELAKSLLSTLQKAPDVAMSQAPPQQQQPSKPAPQSQLPPQSQPQVQHYPGHPNNNNMMLPPGMVMTPNGPVPEAMLAAAMAHHHQQLPPYALAPAMQHGGMGMPPHMMQPGMAPPFGMMPPPQHMMPPGMPPPSQQQQSQVKQGKATPSKKKKTKEPKGATFVQSDFPELGAEATSSVAMEEESKTDEQEISEDEGDSGPPQAPPRPHIVFNNPHTTMTRPIPATAARSSLMPSRDILYVVHTILRPLLPCLSDPYGEDYYFKLFVEQQQRGSLLQHQHQKGSSKEMKEKVAIKELKFRQVVVERAANFKEEKQTLGHIVKTDVRRPRALLATPALHKMMGEGSVGGSDGTGDGGDAHSQRAQLWKARVLVDRGYQAFLHLVEAQRLLLNEQQSSDKGNRRDAIMRDVKRRIDDLHATFGVTKHDDGVAEESSKDSGIAVDVNILRATLLLPKGQELLSRCMEGGCLPHPSACALLPYVLPALFRSPRSSNIAESAVAKEERLCRSLSSLVILPNPQVPTEALLQSLDALIGMATTSHGTISLKQVLGYKARAGVIQAVLAQGGGMHKTNGGNDGEDTNSWETKEAEFLRLLSETS